jgi:hypothetical protein
MFPGIGTVLNILTIIYILNLFFKNFILEFSIIFKVKSLSQTIQLESVTPTSVAVITKLDYIRVN